MIDHVALCGAVDDSAAPIWSAAAKLPSERIVAVAKLFVAPNARGRGVGAALLAAACAEAGVRGLLPALEVLDHDQAAIALYERVGWRRIARATASWAPAGDSPALRHSYIAPT